MFASTTMNNKTIHLSSYHIEIHIPDDRVLLLSKLFSELNEEASVELHCCPSHRGSLYQLLGQLVSQDSQYVLSTSLEELLLWNSCDGQS